MQRTTLLCFLILTQLLLSCGEPSDSLPPTPNPSNEAAPFIDELATAFPELVEKAKAELKTVSGLDLANLKFELTNKDAILDALMGNLGLQNLDGIEQPSRRALKPLARGMIGIYDMDNGRVLIALENLKWLAGVFEKPDAYCEEILFAVIAHEGSHGIADQKYGLVELIQSCRTESHLIAASAVMEGYAQLIARQVCLNTDKEVGIKGLTELITTVPEIEDPAQKLIVQLTVQQFAFSYVEGEAFINAMVEAKGKEGIKLAFDAPPTRRNQITHPAWYLDPSQIPNSDYQVKVALDHFDEFFKDQKLTRKRMDFDEGLLRAAASFLPPEDIDRYATAVVQSRVSVGSKMNLLGQVFAVAALHQCKDKVHAGTFIRLSKDLIAAKEVKMKESATPITESAMQEIARPGYSGFRLQQTVEIAGVPLKTQSLQVSKGDLVCEITLFQLEATSDELLKLAIEVLDKAINQAED